MDTYSLEWQIGEIPFYFTPLAAWQDNLTLPTKLPFAAGLNISTGSLVQKSLTETERALEQAYLQGSIFSGMMEEEGLGRSYADDFLRFLLDEVSGDWLGTANVLEIGCGTGYLLSRLRPHCASVLGIEPGGHSRSGAELHGVPILHDFFPSLRLTGPYDIVLSYCVLEHIQDPVSFLKSTAALMRPGAFLLLAVPDCEPYIEGGDISMFWHEHWSYFTGDSLHRTLLAAGFELRDLRPAGFGGTIYAFAVKSVALGDAAEDLSLAVERHQAFLARGKQAVSRFRDFLASARCNCKTIGFYVPIRAINVLTVTGADLSSCRFFDDNRRLWGSYFPGIPIRIENRGEWAGSPPDLTVIMSKTFGGKIQAELEALGRDRSTRILSWHEMFEDSSRQQQ